MAEFILLNKAILNANGDFKLAIKNIDNIPDGNLPTPTRNLLNEFKNAVKEIEKQVVKADNQAENQANLANQANSGNIDSLTKQISYLQNAIKNSTKDAPTPSPIKQEADSLSQATPNLTQNSIKGDGFVTYPNSARQETAINQNLNIQEWVKNMSGVISDEWRANLTKLAGNHPEMFRSEVDVFRVIKEIKDNPTHFFKNYDDEVALIGKQINDNKFANIGIVKNDGEIIHANKNKIKDLDRLQRRNKEMLTGTPLPATTRANNSMGGDLLQHFNDKTIPNQSIKQAETTVKEATQTEPNTNSRLEKIKKFVEGKTNKALDSEIKTYNELYRYVLDDFAKAHPDELNLPKYASEMANYITKEFLVKHDKEIKEIISQKTSGENRQIVLNAFENLKENFDELRSVGIGDLIKPTAKGIKDKIAEIEIKSMSDKELVMQFQKLKDSKARVNENLYKYLENEIKKREKKLYPFINSDKDYSYDLEKQLKNRGLMGLKDSDLENIAKERNSVLYLPSYIRENIEQELNIKPIKEFGTNYAEFYHDGANAIKKLLTERQGQVAGAFEREELGDIDLVWGEFKVVKGEIKGYGLSKIVEKHLKDFSSFDGDTAQQKMANGIAEIIEKGEIKIDNNSRTTIVYNKNDKVYKIGLKQNWQGNPTENKWIVTAYDDIREANKIINSKGFTKGETLPLNSKPNSTPKEIKSQEPIIQPMMNGFSTMAMEKAILHLGSGGIGGAMNANAEQDPNKKAEAFVKGFLLGAGGSVGAMKMLENSAKLAPQLARTSQRLAKDLPMILNDRPDIIGKALGRTPKENYNYIFGGENAIGANKAKLKTAREMAKNGADESEIWAKTGWYKDIDKKWKFEINPKGGELDISALKKATPNKLGDILKDDELFKTYPQVKDLSILPTQTKDGANAIYHEAFGSRQKAIFFDYDYLQNATNDELKSTLYHEIQHAIQSIESFASGGNTQKLSYEEYKNLAGESEARNVEKRLNRTYNKDDAIDGEFNRLLINDIDNPKWQELKQKRRELILAGKQDEADKIKKQLDQRQEFLKSQAVKNVKEFSSYSPHPFKTLDINPNDRVVKYDSGMSASANPRQKAGQYAKWLSQADKMPPQAPDELYKAYDKAKRT